MDSNFSGISSQIKGLSTGQTYAPQGPVSKNLTQPGAGGAANPELANWYEQAYAYYNAVMSGSETQPDAAAWQDFLNQMQWAAGQLGYGGAQQAWDPSMGGGYGPQGPMQQGPQSNQFGGMSGTMDNWVYTDEKNTVGFTGDGTHDLWGNDVTINVAPTSANVTIENTTDTRFQPNEPVVKITVTDPATGTQAVYFVHDYDPANGDKIKVNTPNSDQQVNNMTGDASITTGKFTPGGKGAAGTKPDASIEGVVQEDGTILYEPEWAGGTIDFWANPGESQTHVIYSDANISVKPSDQVNVSMDSDGVMVVTVTHTTGEFAGTTDTYKVQKGYKANVNVNAEYITYGTPPVSSEEIPDNLADRLTVNGSTSASGDTTAAASADAIVSALLDATSPSRTEAQLVNALKAAGYTYNSIDDLKQAIKDKEFPPEKPDARLVHFLQILDGDLASSSSDLEALLGGPSDKDSEKKSKTEDVQSRLVILLQALYPDSIVSPGPIAGGNFAGSISFNGDDFNWSLKTNGDLTGTME